MSHKQYSFPDGRQHGVCRRPCQTRCCCIFLKPDCHRAIPLQQASAGVLIEHVLYSCIVSMSKQQIGLTMHVPAAALHTIYGVLMSWLLSNPAVSFPSPFYQCFPGFQPWLGVPLRLPRTVPHRQLFQICTGELLEGSTVL